MQRAGYDGCNVPGEDGCNVRVKWQI